LHTFVNKVFINEGSSIKKGSLLFQLDTSQLDLMLRQKQIQRSILQLEIQLLLVDEERIAKSEGKEVELRQADEEIDYLKQLLRVAKTSISAPFDGVVTNLDYRLQPGFQPGEGSVVGELQSLTHCAVHALVPAADIHEVQVGQMAEVWLPIGTGKFIKGKIDSIKSYSERDLHNSPFSSRFGGEVATEIRGEHQQDVPIEDFYDCAMSVDNEDGSVLLGMTGRMAVLLPPRSLITRVVNRILRTFNRESLF
jgi:multidrug resistance efflux pump